MSVCVISGFHRFSGFLRNIDCYVVTDVSEGLIFSTFKGQVVQEIFSGLLERWNGTDILSRNVGD